MRTLSKVEIAVIVCMVAFQIPQVRSDTPSTNESALAVKPILIVRLQGYRENAWRDLGSVIVWADSMYVVDDVEIERGRIPDQVMKALRRDLEAGVFKQESVPTFRFGVDDHRNRLPDGVKQLVQFAYGTDDGSSRSTTKPSK